MVRRHRLYGYLPAALAVLALSFASFLFPATVRASSGDADLMALPYSEGFAADPDSDNPAFDAIAYVVQRAGRLRTTDGRSLLPAGTTVDRVQWVEGIAHIDLTWPAGFDGTRRRERIRSGLGNRIGCQRYTVLARLGLQLDQQLPSAQWERPGNLRLADGSRAG